MKSKTFYFILALTLLFILVQYFCCYTDPIDKRTHMYNLSADGVQIYKNVLTSDEITQMAEYSKNEQYENIKTHLLNSEKVNNFIHSSVGNDYKFQDYIWIIKKSSVHTCHRDNNGDFFNEGQKYPSYTMLVYLEDMEKCLGVVPRSHKDVNSFNYNWTDPIINLPCSKGDVIIFNANLIHVGCINEKENNLRIQLKLTHKDDIEKINYYQNFNKILNQENTLPLFVRKAQKKVSCMLPGISNLTQNENIRTARGSDNGVDVGGGQKVFSYLFYGNKDFYDLPNAF
jgi:ectoine hydroxylase-related dioxygenase (phytanoyl-CoA dioxygenase family)